MGSPSPSLSLYLVLFSLLLTKQILAVTYSNISIGTILTPLNQSSWPSPLGDFAFGFLPLETNSSSFLLSVWFNKIGNKTVVWTANGDNPVTDGSKVELTSDGKLSLRDATGQEIWNPGVSNVSHAAMLDSGNFVLSTPQSALIWQSFDDPTDTILPRQVLREGSQLYARLMPTDYSRGRFELALQNDGNLVLYPIGFPTATRYDKYWWTGTSGSGVRLVYNESGSIYLSFQNDSDFSITSSTVSEGDFYHRATLDPDGIFRYVL